MASTQPARRMVDETWLQGSNGLIVVTRTRVRRDAKYAEKFREVAKDLFLQLWPMGPGVDENIHLTAIAHDIDRMPVDLLDDLVDALGRQAKVCGGAKSPGNAAARIIAGWLRTRTVELRAGGKTAEHAGRLKANYPGLFKELFAQMTSFLPPSAAQGKTGEARLDRLT